ncbi:MAG: glycosyltransferase family 2 protein [Lachnospiraceae bacterium]|nr:glycosyltransferase family 2 protein [Lachnospiraceae bacterium]
MGESIKVSVIIPVYNGELYLRQCLDSVCGQTLKDIEIICVDDGSTDSSLEILKEYQEKDSRIQIYRQKNLYAGVARNTGKSHAIGEYLVFWDCDDFFELNALELMYKKASSLNADICVCGGNRYFDDKKKYMPSTDYLVKKRIPGEVFNRNSNEDYILSFTNPAAWNKLFRRKFIEKQRLDFQPVRNGNDVYFVMNSLCLADKITIVDKALVNYRTNQKQSLIGTLSKSPLAPIHTWMDTADNLIKLDVFPERSFSNKALESMLYTLRNLTTWDAFYEAVKFLQKEALEKMHIYIREDNYYYIKWHNDFVRHLINDTPEELLVYLAYTNYMQSRNNLADKRLKSIQLKDLKNKNKILKNEIKLKDMELKKVRSSKSFKLGWTIMWPFRMIKQMISK